MALITSSCDEYFAQSSANVPQIFLSPAFKCADMIAQNFSRKHVRISDKVASYPLRYDRISSSESDYFEGSYWKLLF